MALATAMRVLVVEDSDDTAMALAVLLKNCGHEPVVATSGEEALQQALVFRPDVMFIHLGIPKLDGLTLARQFRGTKQFAETPLIALSGFVGAEYQADATAAGFTEFLAKPYPLIRLQVTLVRVATRIAASRAMVTNARSAAEKSHQLRVDRCLRTHHGILAPVVIKKSSSSAILTLAERQDAEELRRWLKNQGCRLGPIFERKTGRFAFYVYTKRHCVNELIQMHGGFKVGVR